MFESIGSKMRAKDTTTILIFGLLFFLSIVFFLFHWPIIKPLDLDGGNHYYFAQQMSMGHVLYRDIASDKPPLTEYVGVLCFLACRGKLLPAIILTRFIFFAFYILGAIPLFIISKNVLGKLHLGWLVVLIYLSFNYPYERIAQGADWHTIMNFFGLLSFVFFLKNRYLLTGFFSSLATLSWQPGIIFFIAILSTVILSPDDKKKEELSRMALGFLFPILLLLLYAHINGSLSDLIKQTILYGEINVRDRFLAGIVRIPLIINRYYKYNLPIIILGILGFIINFVQMATGHYKKINLRVSFLLLSILSMTIIFSIVDFQGGPDFISFIPWLSFYAVYSIAFYAGMRKSLTGNAILVCLILVLIAYSLKDTVEEPPSFSLKEQKEAASNLLKGFNLREGDLLFCIQSATPLLFINEKNIIKYLRILDNNHYLFIEKYEEGGFDSIIHSINKKRPKLICVPEHFWPEIYSNHRYNNLKELLETDYEKFESRNSVIYARR